MNGRIESLGLIQSACWRELERATVDREHGWRLIGLATCRARSSAEAEPGGSDLRYVVLREVREAENLLVFYTDARSAKVAQIARQPEGSMLAWSARLGWQLRLRVRLNVVIDGAMVAARWEQLRSTSAAADYLSPLPPGSPLETNEPTHGNKGHFAVVQAEVKSIDWLELQRDSRRRARFDDQGMRWLSP